MDEQELKDSFEKMLKDALRETGASLQQRAKEVAQYMAERTAHLSTIVGEPGFEQALRAERNNIALKAGLKVADNAEAADQRLVGIIQGALSVAAGALI